MKVEQNKPHSIHLRLNEEQFDFVKEMATTADLSVSDFIRVLINSTLVATKKVNAILREKEMELNAKLGEPHADDTSNK